MQFDYDHLRTLAAILDTGSFEAAAAALGISPPAVSQRLKALEDRVGARLVVRAAPCTATPLGARLAQHMADVAVREAMLMPQTRSAAQATIVVNADSLATWVLPALSRTSLFVNLVIDDQNHSTDMLHSGAAVAAVTARAAPVQGCDVYPLGALDYVATAAPEFVARHFAEGVTKDTLEAAPALVFSRKDRLQADWAARETGGPVQLHGHTIPSASAFVTATRTGMGWGLNPEILVRDALASGALLALGTQPHYRTPLYWQIARHMAQPLSELTKAIAAQARAQLIAPDAQSR